MKIKKEEIKIIKIIKIKIKIKLKKIFFNSNKNDPIEKIK